MWRAESLPVHRVKTDAVLAKWPIIGPVVPILFFDILSIHATIVVVVDRL
jgi:hypothetical protein